MMYSKYLKTAVLLISILCSFLNICAQNQNFNHGFVPEPNGISGENTQENIYFPVTSQICYTKISQFTNAEAKSNFVNSMKLEKSKNELNIETNNLRIKYAECRNSVEKEKIATTLLNYENESLQISKAMSELRKKANDKEYAYWINASVEQVNSFIKQNKVEDQIIVRDRNIDQIIINTTNTTQNAKNTKDTQAKNEAIIYKIQVGKYKTMSPSVKNKFDKFSLIRKIEEYTTQDGYTVYTVGKLYKFDDACKMQKQLLQEGFTKTAIIAFQGGIEILIDASTGLPIVFE